MGRARPCAPLFRGRRSHLSLKSSSPIHVVNYADKSVDLHGFAIEHRRLVTPLAHRIQRGLIEERISADHLQRLNCAVRRDYRAKFDSAGPTNLNWQPWIDRLHSVNEHGGINVRNVQALLAWCLGCRRRRTGSGDIDATWARNGWNAARAWL